MRVVAVCEHDLKPHATFTDLYNIGIRIKQLDFTFISCKKSVSSNSTIRTEIVLEGRQRQFILFCYIHLPSITAFSCVRTNHQRELPFYILFLKIFSSYTHGAHTFSFTHFTHRARHNTKTETINQLFIFIYFFFAIVSEGKRLDVENKRCTVRFNNHVGKFQGKPYERK